MAKKTRKLHIGVLCEGFLQGWSGVERVMADLAAEMLARGHTATILAQPPKAPVSPKVPLTALPAGCTLLKVNLDSPEARTETKEAVLDAGLDVLVAPCSKRSFLKAVRLAGDCGIPLVSAECVHPVVLTHERWNAYEHYAALALCDRIQVLLESYRQYYPKALWEKMDSIGNPAPPPQPVDWSARAAKPQKTLLALGRFDEEDKQFTLLLRTWALLFPEFPDWKLQLVGDGGAWDLYHAMVKALGPGARAEIHGSVADPSEFYAGADLLCMPSRQEGFPLVLGEAAAHGLPLVALKSCGAAAALIDTDRGTLAENDSPVALAEALRPLMAAPAAERERLGRNAMDFYQREYPQQRVFDQWESLLLQAAVPRGFTCLELLQRDQWDAALLNQSALELLSRPDTLEPLEEQCSGSAAAMARLRGQYAVLQQEYLALQKRCDSLQRQMKLGKPRR